MFQDIDKNITMLHGAYRKLKSYYYYNKNFIIMRQKIANFENDQTKMKDTFSTISQHLCHPRTNDAKKYFQELIDTIDFYVIPKKFESSKETKNKPVSNTLPRDKRMKTVNFFINMPIELHILDTLWTLYLAKMSFDSKLLSSDVYGNTIMETVVSELTDPEKMSFQNNRLFNIYIYQYSDWRNGAFEALENNYNKRKNSILFSLDIKNFFYSIRFDFLKIKKLFKEHPLIKEIAPLTSLFERIFLKYRTIMQSYREDICGYTNRQYPLPIGLFSSMLLGNLYLQDFDLKIKSIKDISYYGRYVDDLLIVFKKSISSDDKNEDVINNILIQKGILLKNGDDYNLSNFRNLKIQKEKIKIIYIDHNESRSIIDVYNNLIKIIPSQMDPIPDYNMELSSFDENAYSIDNFEKENKLRDIGEIGVDAYKIGKFFSSLIQKYSHVNSFNTHNNNIEESITNNINQIEKFFTGSQCIEYYPNWLNYMYFLVITQRNKELHKFYQKAKKYIGSLDYKNLDRYVFKKVRTINKKVKEMLLFHLDICLNLALSLDIEMTNNHFSTKKENVKIFINSNMFNHNLIAFPLSNYLEYSSDVSLLKMELKDIGRYSKIEDSFKFNWSPRFIQYDELLLLLFYFYHKQNQEMEVSKFINKDIIEKFKKVNHLDYIPFKINSPDDELIVFPDNNTPQYKLRKIYIPDSYCWLPENINIAVANLKIDFEFVKTIDRWKNISIEFKSVLTEIMRETYNFCSEKIKLLVLPELCVPIYWLNDLIKFSKRTQTAIITGLQYIKDDNGRVYNYILTILPFETGNARYKNAFLYIREKNDYSPIEKEELAKQAMFCKDKDIADYQIFGWKGINLTNFVCYEFTDIMARALLKGKCEIIAAPVFNPDTTYFSNIIDSAVRDLHSIIVQANTSIFGDSRITGPYNRDNKDIFKIKGGDNDNVIIGTINIRNIMKYQSEYYDNLNSRIDIIKAESKKKKPNYPPKKKMNPDIKPLSARFNKQRRYWRYIG